MKEMSFTPVIFLDTNALHYIRFFIDFAKKHKITPFGNQADFDEIKDIIVKEAKSLGTATQRLLDGCKILAYLQKKVKNYDSQVEMSLFSKVEITHGLQDGVAYSKLLAEGMPFRLRQRKSDLSMTLLKNLSIKEYIEVQGDIHQLNEDIEKIIGAIINVSDKEREIFAVAEFIQARIFIDIMDCLIYSNSLVSGAEEFLTYDYYLKLLINRIQNPGGEIDEDQRKLWKTLQDDIKDHLEKVLIIKKSKIKLPKVIKILDDLPVPLAVMNQT